MMKVDRDLHWPQIRQAWWTGSWGTNVVGFWLRFLLVEEEEVWCTYLWVPYIFVLNFRATFRAMSIMSL